MQRKGRLPLCYWNCRSIRMRFCVTANLHTTEVWYSSAHQCGPGTMLSISVASIP